MSFPVLLRFLGNYFLLKFYLFVLSFSRSWANLMYCFMEIQLYTLCSHQMICYGRVNTLGIFLNIPETSFLAVNSGMAQAVEVHTNY
jgi:hypothetical protein